MSSIYGVYFICCDHHYLDIVKEQLEILKKGLLQITKKLIIFVTKYDDKDDSCINLDNIFNDYKDKFIIIKSNLNLYEKFAINNYKKFIDDKNYYMYYFHTKGLKNIENPHFHVFQSRRQILNYYTLEMFRINIKLLDESYDAVGCSLHLYPKKHFSGNFWWSKSGYLDKLKDINDKYLSPEMYILSDNNCKYVSLANDTNNYLIENYKFPSEESIEKNLTTEFIIIEEYKKLLNFCD